MAIEAIATDGMLHWTCMGGEKDDHCLAQLVCHIIDARYHPGEDGPRGAMINLPICPSCGTQKSLKADYTLKELFKGTDTILDTSGGIIGYALKRQHVHNLMVHQWLYEQGLATYPPVIAMPAREEISDPRIAGLSGVEALALWFGYRVVQARDPRLESFDMMLAELVPVLTTGERRLIDGAA